MEPKTKWLISKNRSCSCTMTGVWRAVAFCEGCAVIFHSPLGCVHVADKLELGSYYRIVAEGGRERFDLVPLVSSNMREKDTIFGAVNRLHQCISFVMENYKPKCLLIATSCVAGVIGDDVESEAEEAEMNYGIPVLCMPFGGFLGGEYSDGYYKTIDMIIHRFFKVQKKVKGTVLLLGDQMGPEGQYAKEVRRILSLFGLTVKWQFPAYVPFDEWSTLPSAELMVLLGRSGESEGLIRTAKMLEEEYHIHNLGFIYPIGWENTCAWIRKIAEWQGNLPLGEKIIDEEEKRLTEYVKTILHVTEGKIASIGIGRGPIWYDPGDTIRSVSRLHMKLQCVILYDNLSDKEKEIYCGRIRKYTDVPILDGKDSQMMMDNSDLLLTTNEIVNTKAKQFFIPMVPLAGTTGEIVTLRTLYRLLCRYGNKGGIAYATV